MELFGHAPDCEFDLALSNKPDDEEKPVIYARFEIREDEETGRRYWWGSEEDCMNEFEAGEEGLIQIDARHFAVGTVIEMREPFDQDETIALLGQARFRGVADE